MEPGAQEPGMHRTRHTWNPAYMEPGAQEPGKHGILHPDSFFQGFFTESTY